MFPNDPAQAGRHHAKVVSSLNARPDLRTLAKNPVMLTALLVVDWHEAQLPEQRAELYESVVKWLSASRADRSGRADASRCVALLGELALAMQTDEEGRRTRVTTRWAAERVARHFREHDREAERLAEAERFLEEEEVDSGIVVSAGSKLEFSHLTFQEYLAAMSLAGLPDAEQHRILFANAERIHDPEWRELMRLFAGVLHRQGVSKVDALVDAVLSRNDGSLVSRARAVGPRGHAHSRSASVPLRAAARELGSAPGIRPRDVRGGGLRKRSMLRSASRSPRHSATSGIRGFTTWTGSRSQGPLFGWGHRAAHAIGATSIPTASRTSLHLMRSACLRSR